MFFIDIAVPRDIDPDVNNLDSVYLYDIDDLKEVVEENLAHLTLKPVLWNYSSSFGILYKKEPKSKVASFISVLKESGKM